MSLNWREINEVLRESTLYGARISDVVQPDFDQLLLIMIPQDHERHGSATTRNTRKQVLRISHQVHQTVIHLSTMAIPKVPPPIPRFMQLLRARLRGGVIVGCLQYHDQRIVRIDIDNDGTRWHVWTRLWSTAANTFLTATDDVIIDCYYRRPRANEVHGANLRALIAERIDRAAHVTTPYRCQLREHEYESYNVMIDQRYRVEYENRTRKGQIAEVIAAAKRRVRHLTQQLTAAAAEQAAHQSERRQTRSADRYRAIAQLLLQTYDLAAGTAHAILTDPETQQTYDVTLNPRLSAQQNAQAYFAKYKEQKRKQERQSANDAHIRQQIASAEHTAANATAMSGGELQQALQALRGMAGGGAQTVAAQTVAAQTVAAQTVARLFYSHGFTIMVGRSAADNDRLLRSVVKGNDTWAHARGVTGSSVFVRYRRDKSIPLEVLYDAATLAHYFSKARGNSRIDVFYTAVKYLRRAKHAPQGTFIPFHEHGLILTFDPERFARLQRSRQIL